MTLKPLTYLLIFLSFPVFGQTDPLITKDSVEQSHWVERKYNEMSLDERLGQLIMVSVASNESKKATDKIKNLIEKYQVGGVVFLRGGPVQQAQLTNAYQRVSKIPLLVAMDAEWGLAMRLDSTYAFPYNTTLGAVKDSALIEKVGFRMGLHLRRMGVHINFAPVVDVNINPQNPIIGLRSFGEDPENVAQKANAMVMGLNKAGILTSAKHFPGHGDTGTDSHHSLPVIDFDRERLDSVEMYPYKKLMQSPLSSVMVAHLSVPHIEIQKKRPSSLSEQIIKGELQDGLGFKGLVFTDALNMKAVSDFASEGKVELSAFLAGNDMLLMPVNVENALAQLKKAYERGKISETRLAHSVKKILKAKYKANVTKNRYVKTQGLLNDLHTPEDDILYEQVMENALTVLKNNFSIIPVKKLENKKIAYVPLGDADHTPFYGTLKKYAKVEKVEITNPLEVNEKLNDYNLVLMGYHKSDETPWKPFKFSDQELAILEAIASNRTSNSVLTVFAKPYALLDIPGFNQLDAVVMAYQNHKIAQEKAAQLLFGALEGKGILPVSVHEEFPKGTHVKTPNIMRLGFTVPARVGFDEDRLAEVDRLVQNGLDSLMFPGVQVLIARRGKIVYNKSFGKPTYESDTPLTNEHIFDLASLTKILATLPTIMSMEEEDKISLNNTFQELLPEYSDTEIKDVTVLKALSHYGRLPAWIAFYVDTLDDERKPSPQFYRSEPSPDFPIKVFDNLYLTKAYNDSIYNRIGRQELKSNRYRYSDVGYYVFKKYIEKVYKESMATISKRKFYDRLGAQTMGYNPLNRFEVDRLVPTEKDNYFRYKTVQGYVHDMGAAMQGGVGGHAGLFSNAEDVAKMMQMYLQGGYYGGDRFFENRTVKKFNTCYFCDKEVRRGVGFDKPQLKDSGPTCGCVSKKSFGHSGFTGTYTWADPDEEIVYVFLSNRVYPTSSNTLLIKSGLRTRIQQAIYDAIIN